MPQQASSNNVKHPGMQCAITDRVLTRTGKNQCTPEGQTLHASEQGANDDLESLSRGYGADVANRALSTGSCVLQKQKRESRQKREELICQLRHCRHTTYICEYWIAIPPPERIHVHVTRETWSQERVGVVLIVILIVVLTVVLIAVLIVLTVICIVILIVVFIIILIVVLTAVLIVVLIAVLTVLIVI